MLTFMNGIKCWPKPNRSNYHSAQNYAVRNQNYVNAASCAQCRSLTIHMFKIVPHLKFQIIFIQMNETANRRKSKIFVPSLRFHVSIECNVLGRIENSCSFSDIELLYARFCQIWTLSQYNNWISEPHKYTVRQRSWIDRVFHYNHH